jgi:hypothetical protein
MRRVIRLLGPGTERAVLLLQASMAMVFAMAAVGCAPKIGDKCALSTDCSQQGTLVCDTSQPGGYCTQLNCTNGSCPNDAVCVEFQASIPGCAYNDYQSPSRTGRSFCMERCSQDSTCRQDEGYICRDPTTQPWNAAILDNDNTQSHGVCIVQPGLLEASSTPGAAVCPAPGRDAASDAAGAAPDGGDGGPIADGAALDATVEEGLDGGDAAADATLDAPVDTGSADAPGGG